MPEGQLWVGIDVGKRTHHACAVDATGAVVWSRKVGNDQQLTEELVDLAIRGNASVRWAVDLTSSAASLLLTVLALRGQHVVYIPGRVVHTMSVAFPGEAKTDAKDAKIIAEIARTRNDFAVIDVPDSAITNLRNSPATAGTLLPTESAPSTGCGRC